jgi:hypothetical protein
VPPTEKVLAAPLLELLEPPELLELLELDEPPELELDEPPLEELLPPELEGSPEPLPPPPQAASVRLTHTASVDMRSEVLTVGSFKIVSIRLALLGFRLSCQCSMSPICDLGEQCCLNPRSASQVLAGNETCITRSIDRFRGRLP